MKISVLAVACALSLASVTTQGFSQPADAPAKGARPTLAQPPANATSINRLYKQAVYNAADERIGEVDDILITNDGRAVALVVGVGGFLGIGESHVVVPYDAVKVTTKGDSPRLVMNATKDQLQGASYFTYDRNKMVWTVNDPKPKR
jgi:sporulation protein YlmC with PRC-barrel domain